MTEQDRKLNELATIEVATDLLLNPKELMHPAIKGNMDNLTTDGVDNAKLVGDLEAFRRICIENEVTEDMAFAYLVAFYHIRNMVFGKEGLAQQLLHDYLGETQ